LAVCAELVALPDGAARRVRESESLWPFEQSEPTADPHDAGADSESAVGAAAKPIRQSAGRSAIAAAV